MLKYKTSERYVYATSACYQPEYAQCVLFLDFGKQTPFKFKTRRAWHSNPILLSNFKTFSFVSAIKHSSKLDIRHMNY